MQVNKILNIEQAITSNPDETTEVISGYKVVEKLALGFSINRIESEIKDLAYCKTIKNHDSEQ